MVDFLLHQEVLFNNSDNQSLKSPVRDLDNVFCFNLEENFEEEMLNYGNFNQNSNNSLLSANSNQSQINYSYNSSFTPLNSERDNFLTQTGNFQNNLNNNFMNNTSNLINQNLNIQNINSDSINEQNLDFSISSSNNYNQSNVNNSLTSNSNHHQIVKSENKLSLENNCDNVMIDKNPSNLPLSMLPSFKETYSSSKANHTNIDSQNTLVSNQDYKNMPNLINQNSIQNILPNEINVNLNLNTLDENQFENNQENMLLDFDPTLEQNDFRDDQSYSNSSFVNENLSIPSTNEIISNNCGNIVNPIFKNNCVPNLIHENSIRASNKVLNSCNNSSLTINSINKTNQIDNQLNFKQESSNYDCNNNFISTINLNTQLNNISGSNLTKNFEDNQNFIFNSNASLENKSTTKINQTNIYNGFVDNSVLIDPLMQKTTPRSYPNNTVSEINKTNNNSINNNFLINSCSLNENHHFNLSNNLIPNFTNSNFLNSKIEMTGSENNFNEQTTILNQNNRIHNNDLQNQQSSLKLLKNHITSNLEQSTSYKKNKSKSSNQFFSKNFNSISNMSKSSIKLPCAVCGDDAACQHYGVRTCEGCKGFFKRTVQKSAKYACLANKECIVDKKRRNRCQYCRFQKCLKVGMVKEVVRTDSLKGKRGRLPNKIKPCNLRPINTTELNFIKQLRNKLIENHPNLEMLNKNSPENDNEYLKNFYENNYESSINTSFKNEDSFDLSETEKEKIKDQFKKIAIKITNEFASQIPVINELDQNDHKELIDYSATEVFTFFFAFCNYPRSNEFSFDKNLTLSRFKCNKTFDQWFEIAEELIERIHNIKVDPDLFVYLLAIIILSNNDNLKNKNEKIQETYDKLSNSLTEFTEKVEKRINLIPKLVEVLSKLKSLKPLNEKKIENNY